jgi:alanyl-tRNA synthetase
VLNEAFGGRGGGKSDCAQGGADYCAGWQEKLQSVVEKLK